MWMFTPAVIRIINPLHMDISTAETITNQNLLNFSTIFAFQIFITISGLRMKNTFKWEQINMKLVQWFLRKPDEFSENIF